MNNLLAVVILACLAGPTAVVQTTWQHHGPQQNSVTRMAALELDVHKLDSPTAAQILARMDKVYANCKSYRDTGVVKIVFAETDGSHHTVKRPFATAFVRPDRFRFE